jgi:hypothetical protein
MLSALVAGMRGSSTFSRKSFKRSSHINARPPGRRTLNISDRTESCRSFDGGFWINRASSIGGKVQVKFKREVGVVGCFSYLLSESC